MKQTAKRILSIVLSLIMLVSMMTVYTSAANNYVPDEEYYDGIAKHSVVVNPGWTNLKAGDTVTYNFRGEIIKESYDKNIHFSSIQAAFDASVEANNRNPVIILTPGTYLESTVITDNVTLVGANGGINPNVESGAKDVAWKESTKRTDEAILKGVIFVKRTIKTNLEIRFDGVTLYRGFAFMEAGNRETETSVICENTIINGAGNASYGSNYSAKDVFSFDNSSTIETSVTIRNTLVKNMASSSVVGKGVTNFTAENVFFTESQGSLIGSADGALNQEPNYLVKNCMFYNNSSAHGVISVDHSLTDNATRTKSTVEVANCSFIDGDNAVDSSVSPLYATVVGPKNSINVHDCYFQGAVDYTATPLDIAITAAAAATEFKNNIKFNNNVVIGFKNLPDTTGMTNTSTVDFTGNYFATSAFKQVDPVFPTSASLDNVYMDYFYVNEALTVPSDLFTIKSFGIEGAEVDHHTKEVYVTVPYGGKIKLNIKGNDSSTSFKLYDSSMKTAYAEIDTTKLVSGIDKNIFYAVSTSTKYPPYSYKYKVYVSTFDPSKAVDFTTANTYLLSSDVANYATGGAYYTIWDGVSYKFIVGKNAFATSDEIFKACKTVPTIIIPTGTFSSSMCIPRSAIILGAKHGIDPNIRNFENPDEEWLMSEDRSQPDQETVIENAVIAFEPTTSDCFLIIDGFTFGTASGVADKSATGGIYTTTAVENCIFDGAGNGKYISASTGVTTVLPSMISVGTAAATDAAPHQTLRVTNARVEGHTSAIFLGSYFENLILDGCYVAKNEGTLFTNEISSPKDQNFYFEIRNSCFYKNTTTTYYFIVNNSTTRTANRSSSRFVIDNTTFYQTNSNGNGIFGIRFAGATDSLKFTNSNFISDTASAFIPGYENWFIGKSGYKASEAEKDYSALEPITDIVIKNNRFIGKVINSTPNTIFTSEQTFFDYSENYFASSYGKTVKGKAISITDKERAACESYYLDWDMTELHNASDTYNKSLKFNFIGADSVKKVFSDTVTASTTEYQFNIEMETAQANYSVYTDKAMTKEVSNPAPLKGGKNTFYIKFSSYDGTVTDVYTATVTKPAATGASIEKFGSWKISGTNIYACVPIGTTKFTLPEITTSVGATATVYNDAACKNVFTSSAITGITTAPTSKYIKVVSEDGKTTKLYTLSVLQAVNDQSVLAAVQNAVKQSDTVFVGSTNTAEFDIYAEFSEGATMQVYDGSTLLRTNANGSVTVEGVITEKTVKIVITSQTGAKSTYSLRIIRGQSSAEIERIRNMYTNGGDTSSFETIVNNVLFEVVPTLASSKTTFKLYSDPLCKEPINGTTLVLRDYITTAYIKVTSADGTATKVSKLVITCTSYLPDAQSQAVAKDYEIIDAVEIAGSKESFTITTTPGAKKYTLRLKTKDVAHTEASSYAVYADKDCTYRIGTETPISEPMELELDSRNNTFYLRVFVKLDEATAISTGRPVLTVVSAQSPVTYKDSAKIAKWAKDEVEYLNNNGYAYFVGDEKGNFNARDSISRFEVAVVVAKMLGVNTVAYKNNRDLTFKDEIPAWAAPYVTAVYKLGIMAGKSTTEFDGYADTTRQEFARIIVGTITVAQGTGLTLDEIYEKSKTLIDYEFSTNNFADVSSVSKWAQSSIKLAVSYYNVMSGSADNGKLYINPKKAITRQEVAVLIANYEGYTVK